MELHYSLKTGAEEENRLVRAIGRGMNISFKHAVVISDNLRGVMLTDAIAHLEAVVALERTITFRRFKKGIGHRKGLGKDAIGKYPEKAAGEILKILRNIVTNADFKGLDVDSLKLIHIQAQKGITRKRRKPKGRWKLWRTQLISVQVIAKEI